jgi:ABC-type lipoprotein release transport system permease subunit
MVASSYVARINFRNRWRSYVGVAILLALTAGLSLFSLAGARRVQSAYPRYLRAARASTLTIAYFGDTNPKLLTQIAGFPEVARSHSLYGFGAFIRAAGHRTLTTEDIETVGALDPVVQDRFTATSGRLAVPSRPGEVVVNEFAARKFGLRVGDRVALDMYSTEQINSPGFLSHTPAARRSVPGTIVGVGLFPGDVLQDDTDRSARALLTPAFGRVAADDAGYVLQGVTLRRGDSDIPAVERRIAALAPGASRAYRVRSVDTFHAEQAQRPLTIALTLFGVITGIAAALLVSLALGTLLRSAAADRDILAAQGMTRMQIAQVLAAGALVSVIGGVALAVVLAFAASPVMPIGPVRKVEPARGLSFDATILAWGALLLAAFLLLFVAVGAWTYASRSFASRARVRRRSRIADAAVGAGVPTPGVTGLQFAFNPPDVRSTLSSRSVLGGVMIAIAAVTASVTFGASLQHLVHEPRRYGWNWDAALLAGTGYDNMDTATAHRVLDRDPNVTEWSGAYFGSTSVDGVGVPVLGMQPGTPVIPTLLSGRAIRDAHEIVLGARVARELHKHIGDSVQFLGRSGMRALSVVGIATFPSIGKLHAAHTSLGVGALVAPDLVPDANKNIFGQTRRNLGPNVIFVRFRSGVDPTGALGRLRTETKPLVSFAGFDVLMRQQPAEIVNASSTGNAPVVLAIALAVGAVVALALALQYAVRRRRHELMVLKTLGFTRRQVVATVWWQATATIVVAVAIGIPIGAAGGAFMWATFAHALDVVATPTIPLLTVIAVAAAALVIANVTALGPARSARRLTPATVLRSE